MVDSYQKITAARRILELPESATPELIKKIYRRLLARCGTPTSARDRKKLAIKWREKSLPHTLRIIEYYQQYQYSFSKESVKRHQSSEEWWFERFGIDPVWGDNKKLDFDK